MLHRSLFACVPLALVATLVSPGISAANYEHEGLHRALRAALWHLKEARHEIKASEFPGRHRERVERDITVAVRELEGALREGKIDVAYQPTDGWRSKWKSFHNLHQALVELDIAESDLPKVNADWARRRELREAIRDARAHVREALDDIK